VSNDLKLKTELKATPAKKLKMVRLQEDVMFFGLNGKQVTEGQSGVHISWNGSVVVVTSDSFPGEKWLFPAGIMYLEWVDA